MNCGFCNEKAPDALAKTIDMENKQKEWAIKKGLRYPTYPVCIECRRSLIFSGLIRANYDPTP